MSSITAEISRNCTTRESVKIEPEDVVSVRIRWQLGRRATFHAWHAKSNT